MLLNSLSLSLSLSLCALPFAAQAQPRDPVDDFTQQGLDARRDGHLDEAITAFETALQSRAEARTQGNLALALASRARTSHHGWSRVQQLLTECFSHPAEPWVSQRAEQLHGVQREAEAQLGRLSLRCTTASATAQVAERRVSPEGDFWFEPGALTVTFSAPEVPSHTRRVTLTAGSTLELTCDLQPAGTQPPSLPSPTPAAVRSPSLWPWITAASAATALVAGVVLWRLRDASAEEFNSPACSVQGLPRLQVCRPIVDDIDLYHGLMIGSLALSGALALSSTVLFLTAGSARRERSLACGPLVGAPGASCTFRF